MSKWDSNWHERCLKLEAFHAQNGHCNVPDYYPTDPGLRCWVRRQRDASKKKKETLKVDEVARLKRIGLRADLKKKETLKVDEVARLKKIGLSKRDSNWHEKYLKLEAFHAQNGHCNVPESYPTDPGLRCWMRRQRDALKKKKETLKVDQVARLKRIGLRADPLADQWNKQYTKLEAFHAKHGHCKVPANYQPNPTLWKWVVKQHQALIQNTLKVDRVA